MKDKALYVRPADAAIVTEQVGADDLPVVARLVVEIRSDGSTTIARGGLEDAKLGQRVAVEARGDSPLSLALALAKSLTKLPSFGPARSSQGRASQSLGPRAVIRALLPKKKQQ